MKSGDRQEAIHALGRDHAGEVRRDARPPPLGVRDGEEHASTPHQLPLVLLMLAACGIVAISAGGLQLLRPPLDLDGSWTWTVRILGAAATSTGIWLLFFRHSTGPGPGGSGRGSKAESMRNAGLLMALVTILALIVMPPGSPSNPFRRGPPPGGADEAPQAGRGGGAPQSGWPGGMGMSGGGGGAGGGVGSSVPSPGISNAQPALTLLQRISRVLPIILLILLGFISFVIIFRRRRLRMDPFSTGPPLDPNDAHLSLLASLEEVALGGEDPRRQITAAYYRLLSLMAAAGAPREAQEAPHEHLLRTLGPLGVPPEPLHQVAELYVLAQFSLRPVTESHREAAWKGLQASLDSLAPLTESSEGESSIHPVEAPA